MKIALVCSSLYGGGAERFTVTMANRFSQEQGFQIYVVTEEKKAKEYSLSTRVKRVCLIKDRRLFMDAKKVHFFLKKECIDISIGVGIYANLVLSLANIHLNTKVIISERNDPRHDLLSWKSKLLRKLLYHRSDFYVFQTEGAKSFYSRKIQDRSIVIHNPVRSDLPLKSNICNREIVAIGRLLPQKNYFMLLKAFQLVHDKHEQYILRIFGEGNGRMDLEKLSMELNIHDFVKFEGFCLDVHQRIRDADIYVLSSDFEGMPNALMEAMAMGFPVVSTDCPAGGPAELIVDGENGLLVEVGDAVEMAQQIIFLIEHNEVKTKLAKQGAMIRHSHSEEEIVKRWKEIIAVCVNKERSRGL